MIGFLYWYAYLQLFENKYRKTIIMQNINNEITLDNKK